MVGALRHRLEIEANIVSQALAEGADLLIWGLPSGYYGDEYAFYAWRARRLLESKHPRYDYGIPIKVKRMGLLKTPDTVMHRFRILDRAEKFSGVLIKADQESIHTILLSKRSEVYSGTRVSGGPFPSHASWAMGPDLWLTPSTWCHYKR